MPLEIPGEPSTVNANVGDVTQAPEPTTTSAPTAEPTTPASSEPVVPTEPAVAPLPRPSSESAEGRIRGLLAQNASLKRQISMAQQRAQLAESTLAELQALGVETRASTAEPTTTPAPSAAPAARRFSAAELSAEAARVADERAFADACNAAVLDGRGKFGDFDTNLAALRGLSHEVDAAGLPQLPRAFVEAALSTANPAAVLNELGRAPEEANRILMLPPIRQAVELSKFASNIEAKRTATPTVSGAPTPIKPRVGNAAPKLPPPPDEAASASELTIAEWMAARNKQTQDRAPQRRRQS